MKKRMCASVAAVVGLSLGSLAIVPQAVAESPQSAQQTEKSDKDKKESQHSVIAMGDSNLWSMRNDTMGDKGFENQLKDAGYSVVFDASPGRSMKEEVSGSESGANYENITDSIDALKKDNKSKDAVWVMAEGVNDSANVQAGSKYSNKDRIAGVLDKLDGDTVIWPTVAVGEDAPEYYNKEGADDFNKELKKAAETHDNLIIMDWNSAVNPQWFLDGVHYKPQGYEAYIDLLKTHLKAVDDNSFNKDMFNDIKDKHEYNKLVSPDVSNSSQDGDKKNTEKKNEKSDSDKKDKSEDAKSEKEDSGSQEKSSSAVVGDSVL